MMPDNPDGWNMAQVWHDLLFAHWRVDPEILQPFLPQGLQLDLFQGEAWIGVVPFRMSGVRFRYLPAVPGFSAFPEANVRTYAIYEGKPGVFFLSLEAASWLAVKVARAVYRLPYFHAKMNLRDGNGEIVYSTRRREKPPAELEMTYRPNGDPSEAEPGTLDHWLTARYCLYTSSRTGRLLRCDIYHDPWQLQPAEADFRTNTLALSHGIELPDEPPLLHFARRTDVKIWPMLKL